MGVHFISALRDRELPDDVELWDGGMASLDLLNTLAGRRQVIIVDAVCTGSEPGTIFRFTPKTSQQKELDRGLELSAEVEAVIELIMTELERRPLEES